jgi:hypothetical protein
MLAFKYPAKSKPGLHIRSHKNVITLFCKVLACYINEVQMSHGAQLAEYSYVSMLILLPKITLPKYCVEIYIVIM